MGTRVLILQGGDINDIETVAGYSKFEVLGVGGEQGPWLTPIPQRLIGSLVNLELARLGQVASAWAATEELEMEGWSEEDSAFFLKHLSDFAKSAKR